ncbi:Avirulence protein [Phytophthora megakarya]|uniref:Avirulence protein n=1 Tax=Phytophthora megakarya TaxID=4795 RepID=A0A225WCA2_9STRA|nr:Avirulence protein [Phytophthora megakarya]
MSVSIKRSKTKISSLTTSDDIFKGDTYGRLLRVAELIDGEVTPNEEKELPFIKSIIMKLKIKNWIKNEKTDEFVLAKLGIMGLTGKSLTASSNYKEFQAFQIGRWLKKDTPTTKVFADLNLNNLPHGTDAVEYKTYLKYVEALGKRAYQYDFKVWRNLFGGGTRQELLEKARILKPLVTSETDLILMVGTRAVLELDGPINFSILGLAGFGL